MLRGVTTITKCHFFGTKVLAIGHHCCVIIASPSRPVLLAVEEAVHCTATHLSFGQISKYFISSGFCQTSAPKFQDCRTRSPN